MILHPAILTLVFVSLLTTGMILYSAFFGYRILRCWDIRSGSEEQLALERRTYLLSTLVSHVLVFQIGSLFLYIYTADILHVLFVGAMCAAGTLNVNAFGYPAFLLKLLNCIVAGLWLILNHADNQAHDYPLIRKKYALLILMAPLIAAEAYLQTRFFLGLEGDVITSCCGSLFSAENPGISGDLVYAPPAVSMAVLAVFMALTFGTGLLYRLRGQAGPWFSLFSGLTFIVSCVSLISFISVYFYELPTHHCPFCILQAEYGYVGYLLYAALLAGVVCGLGVGLLMPFRGIPSLARRLPEIQQQLALAGLVSYGLFAGVSLYGVLATDFTLGLL
ncbi:MAG: hypothetical protein CVU61_15840 [Deltaproteobacteria bacterium HGW-Deltaproteobacteria-19]|jgi:hypothetical protein|nr:MAG: hypothetical protein CVU61_15840 [Deltaproteobacteria bacterium HGW-Deltaproteobacteria-19]